MVAKEEKKKVDIKKVDEIVSNIDEWIKLEIQQVETLKKYRTAIIQELLPDTWRGYIADNQLKK